MSSLKRFSVSVLMLFVAILFSFMTMSCDIVGSDEDEPSNSYLLLYRTLQITLTGSVSPAYNRQVFAYVFYNADFDLSPETADETYSYSLGYTTNDQNASSYNTITVPLIISSPVYVLLYHDTDGNSLPDEGEPYIVYGGSLSGGDVSDATSITIGAGETGTVTINFNGSTPFLDADVPSI